MVHKEMEVQYVEEQIKNLNQLMLQLDTVPVGKSHGYSAGTGSGAVGVVVQLQRRLKKYSAHPQQQQQQSGPQNPSSLSSASNINLLPVQQNGDLETRRGAIAGLSPVRRTSIMPWGTADDAQQHQQLTDGSNVQLLSSINHVGGNISKMNIQLSFNLEVCRTLRS